MRNDLVSFGSQLRYHYTPVVFVLNHIIGKVLFEEYN